jgi:hypothetical protein
MQSTKTQFGSALLLICLAGGLLVRLVPACLTFLNPDEVLHYLLSAQSSFAATYQATLTTAHPPLMIVLLHYWQTLGHSEFILRLPCLLAALAFAWMMFLWLRRVSDQGTALTGLVLFLFSPALISLSAEVRQYALLLLFCACSLYLLECAVQDESSLMMVLSAISLYLALLTHYSSLIVALTLGIYALVRLLASDASPRLIGAWVIGQLGGLALCAYLYTSHLARLRRSGLRKEIGNTWLRTSIFHPGHDHILTFVGTRTVRLFRYFFSNGTIGVFALLLFLWALVALLLLTPRSQESNRKPTPRHLALLLTLPFFIAWGTAVSGLYPYGGTRHDAVLAIFSLSGVSLGLAHVKIAKLWPKLAVLGAALVIGNLFPFPTPPFIKPWNQNRKLMTAAMNFLRQPSPPGSVILTDYEGGLMLSYYLCPSPVVEIKTSQPLVDSSCGAYKVTAASPELWFFDAGTLPAALEGLQHRHPAGPESKAWLFQAGWIDDKQAEWIAELAKMGCRDPRLFGQNILLCRITSNASDAEAVTKPEN